uniref:Integrase catalytic domain-containing protein n=1 Tax=Bracon brevicornis TaxID=1563983 RepID=A0A6V7KQP7_9HYME
MRISVAKNDEFIMASKREDLKLITNEGIDSTLNHVLYCPKIPKSLLSVARMQTAGLLITFDKNGVKIHNEGKTVMSGESENNLTTIHFQTNRREINVASRKLNYQLWHQRLGHIGEQEFLELKSKRMFEDIARLDSIKPDEKLCGACIKGKQAWLPFNREKTKEHVKRPLFIVHSDVAGPVTPPTVDDKNYFILFIDQYTHNCVSYLIRRKSDVFNAFKDFVAKSEAKFNLKLVNLYCDNGREYLSNEMKGYFSERGISYHLTVPRTPHLNDVAERMVRTITEKARAMVAGAKLNEKFWGEAVLTATHLVNISPSKALKCSKTPYEMWHDKKPIMKYLKVFGSTVYVHEKVNIGKFDEKSWKGILVGYEPNGYKVWVHEKAKFVVERDVIVDEFDFEKSRPHMGEVLTQVDGQVDEPKEPDLSGLPPVNHNSGRFEETSGEVTDVSSLTSDKENSSPDIEPRRSDRIRELPPTSYEKINTPEDCVLLVKSTLYEIPRTFHEIKFRDDKCQWEEAIKAEIDSLLINETWSLVPKPPGKNIVDCKWIFSIKTDEHGQLAKYKARLVARGFSQEYLTDYDETFAPVARIASFRFILAFANQFNLLIHHMDVKMAFLNGNLKEEIYGCFSENDDFVVHAVFLLPNI